MATFKKQLSGNWRVQVRRKGRYLGKTFRRYKDAEEWALDVERRIDRGETPTTRVRIDPTTFGHLVDLHVQDMLEVGKAPRRTKAASLDALKKKLGKVGLRDFSRDRLIQFGKERAKEGAGSVTTGMDLGYIKTILTHAAAVHGVAVSPEPVDLARVALKRLGLIGKGRERDRRTTQAELDKLYGYFDANPRQIIPLARIVRFAIATAMRQDEICRIAWKDVDQEHRTVVVRDRKDPRDKAGNDQKYHCWTPPAWTPGRCWRNKSRSATDGAASSPTMDARSAPPSDAPAGSWGSRSYIFMTSATRGRADCSKRALTFRRWRS